MNFEALLWGSNVSLKIGWDIFICFQINSRKMKKGHSICVLWNLGITGKV
jgi:hypothetical protein